MADVTNIAGRINSISQEGVAVLASQTLDERKNKKQSVVNQETDEELANHGQRIGTLEQEVGSGGSVDERIAQAKSESESDIKGGASSDYDTLKKAEDAIKAEAAARQEADSSLDGRMRTLEDNSVRYTPQTPSQTEQAHARTNLDTYSKTEVNQIASAFTEQNYVSVQAVAATTAADIPTLINATGDGEQTDTLYRVGWFDGTAFDVTKYSLYTWNGTAYVQMAVCSSIGEVFDISVYNQSGGTPAQYETLALALGTNGANVPAGIRRGGMSVKYIQSSDNKYVQFRCMAQSFTTDTIQWQGVDDEPTPGSNNLVKSGGVKNGLNNKVNKLLINLIDPDNCEDGKYISAYGNVVNGQSGYAVSDYIEVSGKNIISNALRNESAGIRPWVAYDANKNKIEGRIGSYDNSQYTYQNGDVYVRFSFSPGAKYANYGTELIQIPYSEYAPIIELENKTDKNTTDIDEIYELKLNGIYTDNLVNPSNLVSGQYLNINGNIANGGNPEYTVSDFIPVNGHNIVFNGIISPGLATFVVYDSNKTKLRVSVNITDSSYIYQQGDFYIRICYYRNPPYITTFADYCKANYGDVLTTHKYHESINLEGRKIDKIPTSNLIDPNKVEDGKYISAYGNVVNGQSGYAVSDFIHVNGQNIISNAMHNASAGIRPWVAYDANKNKIEGRIGSYDNSQYTYQNGDVYVRFSFSPGAKYANYGTELVKIQFGDYAPVIELEQRVSVLENNDNVNLIEPSELVYIPNTIYKVWNDIDIKRQNFLKLGLSRMMSSSSDYANKNVFLKNGLRFFPIQPSFVNQVTESQLNLATNKSTIIRNTPASISSSSNPRILIIGDSVTSGAGATSNKSILWHPIQYWAYSKMLFEMDKIDNNDNGHDALFIGGISSGGNFTINYKSISRDVRANAEGKSGASLPELFTATWGGSATNPFYDSINNTFSILAYLTNYRTMDDNGVRLVSQSSNPHGESVVGSDGKTYTIGQRITTQELLNRYDICTPTHVFINLNHNTNQSGFESNIANVVNIVKTELPDAVFAWLVIDSTGTNFSRDYPDFDPTMIALSGLHDKNCGYFNYFKNNLEDEENGVYLLGLNFIQPEAIDYPFIEIQSINGYGDTYKIANTDISGANYHPNNIAHADWGYELYAFIKWLISI